MTCGRAHDVIAEFDRHVCVSLIPCPSRAYSAYAAYAGSKLALALFSLRLQRLLDARGDPVTANMADPGVANTALYRHAWAGVRALQWGLGWLLFKVRDPDPDPMTPA